MVENFTDEHRDRPVITAEGNRIGTISEPNGNRATIESTDEERENLSDDVREMLGWNDDESNEREIRTENVDIDDEKGMHLHGP